MKQFSIAFTLCIALFAACSPVENPDENPNNQKALEQVRKEEKVKEAVITEANVLYVSVDDNGTSRNGFAEYLCQILKDNNATTKWVKIVKRGSADDPKADNGFGILLGESHCR